MTPELFLASVIRPALARLGMSDDKAERLLMGTAAHESNFLNTRQRGGGPALGYFQMEPATHDDCWKNCINFHPNLKAKITGCMIPAVKPFPELMMTNSIYAAAMARIKYWRAPGVIPSDGLGMAKYWKDNYNTVLGAGTVKEFVADWNKFLSNLYGPIV
jgi:hypothetical protein